MIKESDLIGREGKDIIVRVRRSYINVVVRRDRVIKGMCLIVRCTEFKSQYGCQWPPLMQAEG